MFKKQIHLLWKVSVLQKGVSHWKKPWRLLLTTVKRRLGCVYSLTQRTSTVMYQHYVETHLLCIVHI